MMLKLFQRLMLAAFLGSLKLDIGGGRASN